MCFLRPPHKPKSGGLSAALPADQINVLPGDLHGVKGIRGNADRVVRAVGRVGRPTDRSLRGFLRVSVPAVLPCEGRIIKKTLVCVHVSGNAVHASRAAGLLHPAGDVRRAGVVRQPQLPRGETGKVNPVFDVIEVGVYPRAPAETFQLRAEGHRQLRAQLLVRRHAVLRAVALAVVFIIEVDRIKKFPLVRFQNAGAQLRFLARLIGREGVGKPVSPARDSGPKRPGGVCREAGVLLGCVLAVARAEDRKTDPRVFHLVPVDRAVVARYVNSFHESSLLRIPVPTARVPAFRAPRRRGPCPRPRPHGTHGPHS